MSLALSRFLLVKLFVSDLNVRHGDVFHSCISDFLGSLTDMLHSGKTVLRALFTGEMEWSFTFMSWPGYQPKGNKRLHHLLTTLSKVAIIAVKSSLFCFFSVAMT